ncbi:inositol polyphosphate-5-phosphatase A-like isoform X2 [Lytechinus variegatus]|uniref:inositol polyphosphate-5-phosphatase A-like isoform X2 n=1 Tax=Lytechinus variegatus TaxID=7654 RepID=UPI001BB1E429|nr:inositol polyphosphate-5-phosphatase A-like isoform X2 [Lytechinus variegatus]
MEMEMEPGVLLITANVGSIFEEPVHMMSVWLDKLYETIKRLEPKFIALHCQELGGKNYESSMQHVDNFLQKLYDSEAFQDFDRSSIFLDKEFKTPECFTALGSFYFIHKSLKDAQCYDYKDCKYRDLSGHEEYSSNLAKVTTQEKLKFPSHFFPECKWSRKGFMRTRWSINGRQFELVNVHLFHDANNVIAVETQFPSQYSKTRRKALEFVIQRLSQEKHSRVPFFIFGDFNFRLDAQGVVKALVLQAKPKYTKKDGAITRIEYSDEDNAQVLLTLEKKKFEMDDPDRILSYGIQWLSRFDKEFSCFSKQLSEFDVTFNPSYPYSEDISDGHSYMKTRPPAWCDRVFMSHSAKSLISDANSRPSYNVIGQDVCMGDHKPVFLHFPLSKSGANISVEPDIKRQRLL